MPASASVEDVVRARMVAAYSHPSHVCQECGALVSSEGDWPAVHGRWHTYLVREVPADAGTG